MEEFITTRAPIKDFPAELERARERALSLPRSRAAISHSRLESFVPRARGSPKRSADDLIDVVLPPR